MDLNLTVLCGRLAAAPEHRQFASGSSLLRMLITVRTSVPRRRVDVIPVSWWDPDPDAVESSYGTGQLVWVAGSVQRRFWSAESGRRSRIEVVAHDVEFRTDQSHVEENGAPVA